MATQEEAQRLLLAAVREHLQEAQQEHQLQRQAQMKAQAALARQRAEAMTAPLQNLVLPQALAQTTAALARVMGPKR